MKKINFIKGIDSTCKLLCLGAHSDDIEIGCGGTILRLMKEGHIAEVQWIVFSANGPREVEAKKSANLFLRDVKNKSILINNYKDGFFPYIGHEIKEYFEKYLKSYSPDLIFTHCRNDLHQDHRLISELTWNTFRNHLILEYEIVKYDGDFGTKNFYVHLDSEISNKKIEHIRNCFKTQENRKWFTDDSFLSILRLRGIESNAPDKYAEAFYCRKIVY